MAGQPAGVRLTGSDAIEATTEQLLRKIRAGETGRPAEDADRVVVSVEHHAVGFSLMFMIGDVAVASYEVLTFATDQPLDL